MRERVTGYRSQEKEYPPTAVTEPENSAYSVNSGVSKFLTEAAGSSSLSVRRRVGIRRGDVNRIGKNPECPAIPSR
jgi:hypothetical protein